jgi:hypothetical protein
VRPSSSWSSGSWSHPPTQATDVAARAPLPGVSSGVTKAHPPMSEHCNATFVTKDRVAWSLVMSVAGWSSGRAWRRGDFSNTATRGEKLVTARSVGRETQRGGFQSGRHCCSIRSAASNQASSCGRPRLSYVAESTLRPADRLLTITLEVSDTMTSRPLPALHNVIEQPSRIPISLGAASLPACPWPRPVVAQEVREDGIVVAAASG